MKHDAKREQCLDLDQQPFTVRILEEPPSEDSEEQRKKAQLLKDNFDRLTGAQIQEAVCDKADKQAKKDRPEPEFGDGRIFPKY